MEENTNNTAPAPTPVPTPAPDPAVVKRRWRMKLVGVALLLLFFLPQLIAQTPLRNWVINRFVTDPRLSASSAGASFGWFSPLRLDEFQLVDRDASFQLTIEEVNAEKSWPGLWRSAPELGSVELDRPRLDLLIDPNREAQPAPAHSPAIRSTLSVNIRDGSLAVRIPQRADPVVDISGLQIAARIERLEEFADDGRFLTVEPSQVMARHPLTPELTRDGLQLVTPFLARAMEIDGSLSIELLACRVPLDIQDVQRRRELLQLEGIVHLHRADAELKNSLLQAIVRVVALLLRRDAPLHVRVADNTQVKFEVREGRVHHRGLAFVLPDVAADMQIRTSGSVGLDESLDLTVEVQLPANLPVAEQYAGKVMQLQVTGTIDEPKYSLPGADGGNVAGMIGSLLKRFQPKPGEEEAAAADDADADPDAPLDTEQLTESVVDLVGKLIEARRETSKDGEEPATPLLDRLRERREQRRK